jgi:hypothetical protein
MKDKKYQPPKPTTGDTAHLVSKAILSTIPAASELFEHFLAPPLQRRLVAWRENVAEALRQLESRQGIDLTKLQSDEYFISIVMQATTIAMRNHQAEKLTALQNAIVNSAIPSRSKEDLHLVFVRFIDELTPIHVKLLSFLVQEEMVLRDLKSYPQLYDAFDKKHPHALPHDEFKMTCGDLEVRGLVRISQDIDDFADIYQASSLLLEQTRDDLPRIIVTDIAKEFLWFIAKNPLPLPHTT